MAMYYVADFLIEQKPLLVPSDVEINEAAALCASDGRAPSASTNLKKSKTGLSLSFLRDTMIASKLVLQTLLLHEGIL